MYKLLLTSRYLRRKLIPLFATLAVVLCTAMVIIVISIMGGFLDLVKNAGRTLMGDVSINAGLGGFAHYDELIAEIEKLPEAEAATPIIVAYGLLKLPGDTIKGVQVFGIDGHGTDRVTSYRKTLYWTKQRLSDPNHLETARLYQKYDPVDAALKLKPAWPNAANEPALVAGIEVSPFNRRLGDGSYRHNPTIIARRMTLTVLPVTKRGGMLEPATDRFVVVNEFHSGVFDVDDKRVFIPFDVAQKMMRMDEAQKVDTRAAMPQVIGKIPARCTEIHVRAAPGVSADQLRSAVVRLYDRFTMSHDDLPPRPYMSIATWKQRQAKFLSAVENEKGLMTVLFGVISVTAVVMIGVVFYMIVLEKTRDIGILRAVGASRAGVASIFLSFGGAIGILGAGIGTGIAWLIVTYINEIHAWLGEQFGIVIWDRSVYFFDEIPHHVNWNEVAVIVIVAVVASVVGAAIPAIKAAMVDPVKSLRYE